MINIGFTWYYPYCLFDRKISAEKWHCWRGNCHICNCRRECCHISTFLALHILWDWTKYNHNQLSWLSEPSITLKKYLAYCDTGVYNTCFRISSDLASSKKNHHLGFQQGKPIGVLPCYLNPQQQGLQSQEEKIFFCCQDFKAKRRN